MRNHIRWSSKSPGSLDTPVGELIANPQLLNKVDACQIDAGAFTVKDNLEELRKPGRDPREQFVAPNFNEKSANSPMFSQK
jgi:protein Tex